MTPSDTQGPLQPGALLAERYHIEHVLHAGSPDRRYLARDQQDGMRALLLQELPAPPCPTRAAREEATAWLAARVEQLCGMAHPGLCPVRGFHAPRALAAPFYLIHDHVPGMTLAEEYEEADGDLSWRQVLDWGIALCDALAYLHGRQPPYVLGSLHPRHVVLDARDRRPRVIDAGVARWLMPVPVAGWGLIAFEQLIGREDPRSDLYALGATLHTLLSGHDADAELGRLRRAGMDV